MLCVFQNILLQLKLQMITFNLIPPFTEQIEVVRKKLLISREALELGAGVAIEAKNMDSFGRHIAQLKPYYADYTELLPDSARRWALTGKRFNCNYLSIHINRVVIFLLIFLLFFLSLFLRCIFIKFIMSESYR